MVKSIHTSDDAIADASAFDQHLEECAQCREHPFDLCAAGAQLLERAVVAAPHMTNALARALTKNSCPKCGATLAHIDGPNAGDHVVMCPQCDPEVFAELTPDQERSADSGRVVHVETYRDHKIEVIETERARPFCVAVDGRILFGSGGRVRRRLNYSTHEAAAAQARRHIRQLGGGVS
ncbi:MAG TPA: hypothetical protein VJN18_11145 [Polyangiaceae bacterium]|nr:hypothetical protein [Polyangiaceae bacterium]